MRQIGPFGPTDGCWENGSCRVRVQRRCRWRGASQSMSTLGHWPRTTPNAPYSRKGVDSNADDKKIVLVLWMNRFKGRKWLAPPELGILSTPSRYYIQQSRQPSPKRCYCRFVPPQHVEQRPVVHAPDADGVVFAPGEEVRRVVELHARDRSCRAADTSRRKPSQAT